MLRILIAFCLMFALTSATSAVPEDVPTDHWAYDAVKVLMDKGYIQGYPDGKFLGQRQMTRYEFAVVVSRLMEGLENAAKPEGVIATPSVPQSAGTVANPTPQVTKADLETIQKLVDEFKTELTVIGTRVANLENLVAQMGQRVGEIDAAVKGENGELQSARADVKSLTKVKLSGYVQARYTVTDMQESVASKQADEFNVRRARLKVTAKPTDKSTIVLQAELGKSPLEVKDAYLSYALSGDPANGVVMTIGQMYWPCGPELTTSSAMRDTPERTLIVRRLYDGERDKGITFSSPLGTQFVATLGVFNGAGANKNDTNDDKDLVVNLKYKSGRLTAGASGYFGKTFTNGAGTLVDGDKARLGVNASYASGPFDLRAEWMRGRGMEKSAAAFAPGQWIGGGYAQAGYAVDGQTRAILKYSQISEDPQYPAFNSRSSWDIGLIRTLDSNTKAKIFFQINKEEVGDIDNDVLTFEWLTTY